MVFGECHAHIFMDAVNYPKAKARYQNGVDRQDVNRKLLSYAKAGIDFVRDGGDHFGASVYAREKAKEYGITYLSPIFAIHKRGHYGEIVGRGFDTMKEYAALVKDVKDQHGDFIKVMFSGIMDFSGDGGVTGTALDRATIREMIHIAHEEGFALMAHVNGARAVQDAVEGGADSVEHGNFMDEECLQALAQSHTVWVPTHVTIHNLIGNGRFDDALLKKLDLAQARAIARAWELGATLALGSDAGAYCVPHVIGLRDEYRSFQRILGSPADMDERLREGQRQIMERFRRS